MNRRKLPPYVRRLDPAKRQSIAMLTGSGAWKRAESISWFPGCKLVLPFGDNPMLYRWPVIGRDCILFSFGDPEPRERLVMLSVELVRAGALFVIWATDETTAPLFRAEPARRAAA